ncbi:MAG: hypothetical protein NC548_06430 [Lachnospiraceae bacterium]|nr:hypothetical protein [Lachnospiraceae bacterium]
MNEQYKVDYIFGLSEMLYRVRANNLQGNSILVISYAHQYQCRSYVVTHAIDKGWYSNEVRELMDFMASGRVVFFAKQHYVGTCQATPREMTKDEMIDFQSKTSEFARERAAELADIAEAASKQYQSMMDEWLYEYKGTDRIRVDDYSIFKVDDPTR